MASELFSFLCKEKQNTTKWKTFENVRCVLDLIAMIFTQAKAIFFFDVKITLSTYTLAGINNNLLHLTK